jgi:hypothetical protein
VTSSTRGLVDVCTNRGVQVGSDARQTFQQFVEGHRRVDEILGLLAKELDEAFGVEIEQVAEEDVGRLRLDALGELAEVAEVRGRDDLRLSYLRSSRASSR